MQCLKLIKIHELGNMKRANVHYSSPLHPRPALEKKLFGRYTWLYVKKKRFLCFICNLQEDVCFIIKSWGRFILECAYMILKMYVHLHMQTWKKSLRLTCRQFWNILSLCSSNICAESFAFINFGRSLSLDFSTHTTSIFIQHGDTVFFWDLFSYLKWCEILTVLKLEFSLFHKTPFFKYRLRGLRQDLGILGKMSYYILSSATYHLENSWKIFNNVCKIFRP